MHHGFTENEARARVQSIVASILDSSKGPAASASVQDAENLAWASTQSDGSKRIKLEQMEAAEIEACLNERTSGSEDEEVDEMGAELGCTVEGSTEVAGEAGLGDSDSEEQVCATQNHCIYVELIILVSNIQRGNSS